MQDSPTFPTLGERSGLSFLDCGTLEKYITPPQYSKRRHIPERSSSPFTHNRHSISSTPLRTSPVRTSRGISQSDSKTEGLLKKLRAWEERALVWAKERKEFQKHMEHCTKSFKGGKLFKQAWYRKASLGGQLDSQCSHPTNSLCFEGTSRVEDLKDTAYSSNVASDDESSVLSGRNLKTLMKSNRDAIAKLKGLLEEEAAAKAKLEGDFAVASNKLALLDQHVQSLELSLGWVYEVAGLTQESLLKSDTHIDHDFGALLQRLREMVVTSEQVDMYKAKAEALYGSFLCPKCSKVPHTNDIALIELERKESEVQTLIAQTSSLKTRLSHEQDLNSQYLAQVKDLQAKLVQSRRAAIVNDTEQEALTERLTAIKRELRELKAEHSKCSLNSCRP